jgi:putative peptide zinc metalloprotease protein
VSSENLIVRLKPELDFSSGEDGKYIVEDRLQQKYWRIGPLEYELCALLVEPKSLADAASGAPRASGTLAAAGAEKLRKSLVWLLQSGILEIANQDGQPGTPASRSQAEPPLKLFDPSFFRINLLGTDAIEKITKPLLWLISYPVLCLAIFLWLVAGVYAYQNMAKLSALSFQLFVPGRQWWFLLGWCLLKFIHEMGHAVAAIRVGMKPPSAGIGFIFFTPSPFVNTTNAWALENRWARILVSSAGILFEVTVASLAVLIACHTESPSLQYVCASIITLGTISTFAFNGNPLFRFDGYYILIDLIRRPNLWQDAQSSTKKLLWSLVARGNGLCEIAPMLHAYGLVSLIYRVLSLSTIAWALWVAWDGLGLLVVGLFACLWFVVPRLMKRACATPASAINQTTWWRELSPKKLGRLGLALCMIVGLGFLPSPFQLYWPGCIDFVDPVELRAYAPGTVSRVFFHDGQGVRKGDEIIRLTNPELELECRNAEIEWRSCEEKCNVLRAQRKEAELHSEESNLESLKFRYESFCDKVKQLSIRAPRDGVLLVRASHNLNGVYFSEGHAIGIIVDPARLEVRASAPAERWETLSRYSGGPTDIHLTNGERWTGELVQVLPRTSDGVEFPALAGIYGGPLTVKTVKSEDGSQEHNSIDPRCQMRISLRSNSFQRSMWGGNYRPNLPAPGVLCSIKLQREQESIWKTIRRWGLSALRLKFSTDPTTLQSS